MSDDVVGIILAGGQSTRLAPLAVGAGGKAAVELGGVPLLTRACDAVGQVVPRVIVVAAAGQPLPPLAAGIEVIRDSSTAAGPLAALRDGLEHAARAARPPRWAFVGACDIPLLAAGVVRLLVEVARSSAARFVVPVIDGHPQVLTAVVACDLAMEIDVVLAGGGGPRRLLEELAARQPDAVRLVTARELAGVDAGLESFVDVDTPEDLARVEARGFPPSRG